jgi:hypothetical protein
VVVGDALGDGVTPRIDCVELVSGRLRVAVDGLGAGESGKPHAIGGGAPKTLKDGLTLVGDFGAGVGKGGNAACIA